MKIAVCISGLPRGDFGKNLSLLKEKFPYDYYYATWTGKDISGIESGVSYFDEPEISYHPILDVEEIKHPKLIEIKRKMNLGIMGKEYLKRTSNHTKQILIHNKLMKKIPAEYDMIVRARFDTVVSQKVNFLDYLDKSYNENISVGFGVRKTRYKTMDLLYEIPKIYPSLRSPETVSRDWGWYLMDPLIFHPRKLWNSERVDRLHKEMKLLPAEYGWYQILSQPYDDSHLCVYGGAQIEKYM